MKYALCVGINDYPGTGNDLQGCVNDSHLWAQLLSEAGHDVLRLTDGEATKQAILQALTTIVKNARYGDRVVFTYSGHGSWVPDVSGDELDRRDEVLVPANLQYILDDELDAIFSHRTYGVRIVTISDSCYSGTVTRAFDASAGKGRSRYLPPNQFLETPALLRQAERVEDKPSKTKPGRSSGVLLSGCSDFQVSWDAWFEGKAHGAMTYYAAQTLRNLKSPTYKTWHKKLRETLPNADFDQTPMLVGAWYQRRWRVFQ